MKTYSVELRHAVSKRKINSLPNNRLSPLRRRLPTDADAIAWAQSELLDFARRRSGPFYQYVEAAVIELLAFGDTIDGKDYRRVGRWVCNAGGLAWRATPASSRATVDA